MPVYCGPFTCLSGNIAKLIPRPRSESLVGSGAPYSKPPRVRQKTTVYGNLGLVLDLPLAGSSLDLLDAIDGIPETAASATDVAAAGGNGMVTVNANILRLEVVQGIPLLYPSVPAEAFQEENVEEGPALVQVFEGQIVDRDPSALVEYPCVPGGGPLTHVQVGDEAPRPVSGRGVAKNIYWLLLHVLGPFRGRVEKGCGNLDWYVVIQYGAWLGYPL